MSRGLHNVVAAAKWEGLGLAQVQTNRRDVVVGLKETEDECLSLMKVGGVDCLQG